MKAKSMELTGLLEELRELLTIDTGCLNRITDKFVQELDKGLSAEGGTIVSTQPCTFCDQHARLTNVIANEPNLGHVSPSGRETGSYLAIDMGGTNLRVYNIHLCGDDGEPKVHQSEYQIPEELKDGKAESLWDHIASRLQDYLTEHHIEPKEGGTLPLTFIFSYPMTQHNIDEGILQRWTKGFNVDGVEGRNVTDQFKAALSKRNIPIAVTAMTNDTTATLMASTYMDPKTKIGCVFGTGCNAAYVEDCGSIDDSNLSDVSPNTPMVINCEWGAFDNDHKVLPRTHYDKMVDEQSPRPGQQTFEKMVAGHYLGEIFRLIIVTAHEKGFIFDGQSISQIQEPYSLDSAVVSKMEQDVSKNLEAIEEYFRSELQISCTQHELHFIHHTAELIISRAAHLSACGIAAICKKKGHETCHVGAEGSLFEKNSHFTSQIANALAEILDWPDRRDEDPVVMFHSKGSGVGAAVIAALTLQRAKDDDVKGISKPEELKAQYEEQ